MKNKLNKKQRRFQTNRKAFILMTVLCMGIGFAFLSSTLTITGNTSVSGNKWNVYFTNVQVSDGSVEASVVPTTSGTNTTSIDYTVTLDKPGDFYEFTVDAVNNGTIDAMIKNVDMTSLDTDVAKYLSYTATYLDGTELAQNDVLEADDSTTYKVRVEFKKNIEASDLSEESTNLTLTFGVNYAQSTIKAKKFINLVRNSALSDSSINFGAISSSSNGRGLYVMNSTTEDDYPIYYYRGNVNNNNAKFAGFCWKIVRTTETGGTKLIYNGLPRTVYPTKMKLESDEYKNIGNNGTYPYTYNSNSKEWTSTPTDDVENMEITFSVEETGDYFFNYNLVSESYGLYAKVYKDQELINYFHEGSGTIEMYNLTPENVLKITYSNYSRGESSGTDSLSFNIEKGLNGVIGCDNTTGSETQLASTSAFNTNSNSLAYNGYMYGTVYEYESGSTSSSDVYGNTFTYSNGTYTLSDTHVGVDENHHYTCLSSGTTCESIKYVYYFDDYSSIVYYITLTGGKDIDTALREMQTNTTNSTIKTAVDNWFNNTFRTYFTNNSKNYNDYLEDTVWCNDRSMNTIDVDGTGHDTNNGWKPNGGSIDTRLMYSSGGRMQAGTPRINCPNKNDSFTVEESATGNGALIYPVGLLTADEIVLAGGQLYDVARYNKDFYLYTGQSVFSMSPYVAYRESDSELSVVSDGRMGIDGSVTFSYGVRPSISLKSNVKVATGGDGTTANPYEFVVE